MGTPSVDCEIHHPILSVGDLRGAVDYYTKALGFELGFMWGDPPNTAGVNLGRVSIHLSLGTPNPQGASVYFVVGDADELFAFQQANGAHVVTPPTDQPWGLREYKVRDRDGHELRFGHHLPQLSPALEIERVDVDVRLERRLAALLEDLARHKHMDVNSCLEEMLLHSFEPVDHDGVASPHSKSTLRHIEALKQKHGIDYDTHASYRFVERPPRP
jgi:uncharacterized glyoxalase superfamily protein PhnB